MFPSIPPLTRALIAVNVAMFLGELIVGDALTLNLALWPIGTPAGGGVPGFEPWQIVSYSFLHGSLWHLFVNMFALYLFGGEHERLWGPKRFLNLYFMSVITASN